MTAIGMLVCVAMPLFVFAMIAGIWDAARAAGRLFATTAPRRPAVRPASHAIRRLRGEFRN